MQIGGVTNFGLPEILLIFGSIAYIAILIGIAYWVIKKAVKNGIIEAHAEIHKEDLPPT